MNDTSYAYIYVQALLLSRSLHNHKRLLPMEVAFPIYMDT